MTNSFTPEKCISTLTGWEYLKKETAKIKTTSFDGICKSEIH